METHMKGDKTARLKVKAAHSSHQCNSSWTRSLLSTGRSPFSRDDDDDNQTLQAAIEPSLRNFSEFIYLCAVLNLTPLHWAVWHFRLFLPPHIFSQTLSTFQLEAVCIVCSDSSCSCFHTADHQPDTRVACLTLWSFQIGLNWRNKS